jgi:hypothetical protein
MEVEIPKHKTTFLLSHLTPILQLYKESESCKELGCKAISGQGNDHAYLKI